MEAVLTVMEELRNNDWVEKSSLRTATPSLPNTHTSPRPEVSRRTIFVLYRDGGQVER
jgi:hypothetical protein